MAHNSFPYQLYPLNNHGKCETSSLSDFVVVQVLNHLDQGLGSQAATSLSLQSDVELPNQSQARKRQVHLVAFLHCNCQVFDEMLDIKSRVEVAVNHSASKDRQGCRISCSNSNCFDCFMQIQATFASVDEPFDGSSHIPSQDDLVYHFCVLPLSWSSIKIDCLTIGGQKRSNSLQNLALSATHGHKLSFSSSHIATRYRSVNTLNAERFSLIVYLQCKSRFTSCVVNQYRAFFHISEYTALSKAHFLNVYRVSKHQEENINLRGQLFGLQPLSSHVQDGLGLFGGAIKY